MMPFWGSDPLMDVDDLADLQSNLQSAEYFDQFREKWLVAVQLDENMVLKLSEKEWNEQMAMFVDLPSSCHFDYDEDRERSFDSALNSMLTMENFTAKMSTAVDGLLQKSFVDWSLDKIDLLNGGGGMGAQGEAELSRVYAENAAIKTEMHGLQYHFGAAKQERDDLAAKVELLEPDAIRCQELVERSTKLAQDLQTANTNLVNLNEKHNFLTMANKKLKERHEDANDAIKKHLAEIASLKAILAKVQAELDRVNSIQDAMTAELDAARVKEQIRLFELVHSAMQTEPFIVDAACQTDFIVAPMSLHHNMSASISHSTPASSKRSFYPVVTAGAAPRSKLQASLQDEYDTRENTMRSEHEDFERSLERSSSNISNHFDNDNVSSIFDGTEFLEERSVLTPITMHHESDFGSRPGSKVNSRGFNESLKMLNKMAAAKNNSRLDVGLPSIHASFSEASSDAGSLASTVTMPLSGKLSPIKYVKERSGPMWSSSDTIRMQPRRYMSHAESSNEITTMLEAHRRNQAPSYRKDMNSN
jgi:hypothetical protein